MEKITISLAGQSIELQEFTLGQLEDMQDLLLKEPQNGKFDKTRIRRIIAIACSVDHPQFTFESLGTMRFGPTTTVAKIVRDILKFAGFTPDEEKSSKPGGQKPGELQAG